MAGKQTIDELITQFSGDVNRIFGKDLQSVILFGSAVTDDFVPGKSDLNFLVVLSESAMGHLDRVQKPLKKWQKNKISVPLFVSEEYIKASLDSFPIEFLNMQTAYRLISGSDVLKELKFSKSDIRLQCERELKGKLLQLRQGYIQTGGKAPALQSLVSQSIVTFTSIFKALIFLKDLDVPVLRAEVMLTMCREYELDEGLFSVLLALRGSSAKLSGEELLRNVKRYIFEIARLSELVDQMKVK